MHTRTVEIIVGLFVAIGLAALFFLAMQVSNLASFSSEEGFDLRAKFENIGGLKVRAAVAMGGVKIGSVSDIRYDMKDFVAIVTLRIDAQYLGEEKEDTVLEKTMENGQPMTRQVKKMVRYSKIPSETSANIYTAGLLGEQYISLHPFVSADEDEASYLPIDAEILTANSALILEEVIGKLVFSMTEGKSAPSENATE